MISERISDDIPPKWNFEYVYPHSNALLQFGLESERWKQHKAARHPAKCDVIYDVKLFPAVYRRIYCRKFLTLSNQTSRYKSKCIRMTYIIRHWSYQIRLLSIWATRRAIFVRIQHLLGSSSYIRRRTCIVTNKATVCHLVIPRVAIRYLVCRKVDTTKPSLVKMLYANYSLLLWGMLLPRQLRPFNRIAATGRAVHIHLVYALASKCHNL